MYICFTFIYSLLLTDPGKPELFYTHLCCQKKIINKSMPPKCVKGLHTFTVYASKLIIHPLRHLNLKLFLEVAKDKSRFALNPFFYLKHRAYISLPSSSSAALLQDLFQLSTILPLSTLSCPIPNRLGLVLLLLPGQHCYSTKEPVSRSQYLGASI